MDFWIGDPPPTKGRFKWIDQVRVEVDFFGGNAICDNPNLRWYTLWSKYMANRPQKVGFVHDF